MLTTTSRTPQISAVFHRRLLAAALAAPPMLWAARAQTAPAAIINTKLNPDSPDFADVLAFRISPDGTRVVYLADQDIDGVFELFSVPIEGGAAVKLNPPLGSDRFVFGNFQISPDSSRVVYLADQGSDEVSELFVSYESASTPTEFLYLPILIRE